jgi:hypothetical protein
MADDNQQTPAQYSQVYALVADAGIKRDGTSFDATEYTDGVWCRFQRKVPVKMGGYLQMFGTFTGIERGMIANSENGVNYVFAGNNQNLEVFVTGQSLGVGSGPYQAQMMTGYSEMPLPGDVFTQTSTTSFTLTSNASTPVDYTSIYPVGTELVFSQSISQVMFRYTVTSSSFASPVTTVNFDPPFPDIPVPTVFLADQYFAPDPRLDWQFDFAYNAEGGNLSLLAHPGLNLQNIDNGVVSQLYYGAELPGPNYTWVMQGLADTGGQNPTYKAITCDGGVVMLYPFIFVYGSNGFIANNNVDSTLQSPVLTDWNGPLANQVN